MREGVPNDEKGDLEDADVVGKVWTGVLPLYESFGEPVAGPYNVVEKVPEHVTKYRETMNKGNFAYAEAAARKDAPVKKKEIGDEE